MNILSSTFYNTCLKVRLNLSLIVSDFVISCVYNSWLDPDIIKIEPDSRLYSIAESSKFFLNNN